MSLCEVVAEKCAVTTINNYKLFIIVGLVVCCVVGNPICVRCAYSARVAVAYRTGAVRSNKSDPNAKYINLCVAIYECESSGEFSISMSSTQSGEY